MAEDNELELGPKPWTRLSKDEVESHRNLDCRLYDVCLDYAIECHWGGWTCKFCSNQILGQGKKEVTTKELLVDEEFRIIK